jgi:hypothetical protein
LADLKALRDRARSGDKSALPAVRAALDALGDSGIRAFGGDIALRVKLQMVGSVAGNDLGARDAMMRMLDSVEDELAGPNPSPLVELLAERCTIAWFAAHHADRLFFSQTCVNYPAAKHFARIQESANKRFLTTCKSLALVRNLAQPTVQINLGRKQVNIAGRSGRRRKAGGRQEGLPEQ